MGTRVRGYNGHWGARERGVLGCVEIRGVLGCVEVRGVLGCVDHGPGAGDGDVESDVPRKVGGYPLVGALATDLGLRGYGEGEGGREEEGSGGHGEHQKERTNEKKKKKRKKAQKEASCDARRHSHGDTGVSTYQRGEDDFVEDDFVEDDFVQGVEGLFEAVEGTPVPLDEQRGRVGGGLGVPARGGVGGWVGGWVGERVGVGGCVSGWVVGWVAG